MKNKKAIAMKLKLVKDDVKYERKRDEREKLG